VKLVTDEFRMECLEDMLEIDDMFKVSVWAEIWHRIERPLLDQVLDGFREQIVRIIDNETD